MPDSGPCLQQHKVRSLADTVLELSSRAEFCSSVRMDRALHLSQHGRQLPEMSCCPLRSCQSDSVSSDMNKTEDEGLNEKQITVDSVLPPMQELQEFRVSLLPSQKPGIYSPLQSYSCRDRHRWTDAQCSPHFISVPFRFTESTFPCLPWMHTQS